MVSPSPSFEWEHMVDPSAVAPRAAATVVQALAGCETSAKITMIIIITITTGCSDVLHVLVVVAVIVRFVLVMSGCHAQWETPEKRHVSSDGAVPNV